MTATLPAQLRAEQAAERKAESEAQKRHGIEQYERFRTDAERARLASTDAARIVAEDAHRAALIENLAAERAISKLTKEDGASLFYRDLSPHLLTAAARGYVQRGRAAQEAIEVTREALRKAVREHNVAVREIDANASARRRASKVAAGEMPGRRGAA